MNGFIVGMLALLAALLAIVVACHALLTKKDSQAALGWVALIFFLPFAGSLVYILFGVSRINSRASELMLKAAEAQSAVEGELDEALKLAQHDVDAVDSKGEDTLCLCPRELPPAHIVAEVGKRIVGKDPIGGNALTFLRNGEEAYPQMLASIAEAKNKVYLSTYIFKGGKMGHTFADALKSAAGRGLDVRLIVDGLGGVLYSVDKPWMQLEAHGVQVARFLPPSIFPPKLNVNLRTHRKVLVCDGTVGYTGGMNIGDHHMLTLPGKHKVQDIHFRCQGPIAAALDEAFLMDWAFVTLKSTKPDISIAPSSGTSYCRLVFDGLGGGRDNIHDLLCGVISGARHHVRIMSPYFLPPRELSNALSSAVLRGVKVELILPQENNLPYVEWASNHLQKALVDGGMDIYYQAPPFAHTKLLLVDNYYCLVGSANLDPRSLFLNFELNLEIFDLDMHKQLADYFDVIRIKSERRYAADYRNISLPKRLRNAACWIFSPYL